MAFLKELESKKDQLKKVDAPKEVKHLDKLIFESDDDYLRLMKETNFENYYDLIEDFTFKSVIISLSQDEIKLLLEENVRYLENPGDVSAKSLASLSSIEKKINDGIQEIRQKIKNPLASCFLRLSTRSPKDAIFHMKDFSEVYATKLKEVNDEFPEDDGGEESIYAKLMAFYLASTEILSISDGNQGARLLVMSNRIQGDLKLWAERSDPLNLIIREFIKFPVQHELRGFVWKSHLTAISQYNNIAYLPSLVQNKKQIEEKVKIFMEKFIKVMSARLENFVVDIVLDYEGNVWIVELNPIGELTGSCLFSWKSDRDLLLNEDGRFEFRIQDDPPPMTYIKGELSEQVIAFLKI